MVIPVHEGTGLALDALGRALEDGPAVVSIMWVNNETGDVQPLAEAAVAAQAAGVPIHSDAVQALGKIPVSLADVPLDLMTLTGHKLGGPTSAGALFVRAGTDLAPLLRGGGQERGLRPGTEDVAGAVGLATAVRIAVEEQQEKTRSLASMRDALFERLQARIPDLVLHGVGAARAPHILNVGVPGYASDALVAALDLEGVAVSGGSACSSGSSARSYVLAAVHGDWPAGSAGAPPASLRFSFGWTSGPEDVASIGEAVDRVIARTPAFAR